MLGFCFGFGFGFSFLFPFLFCGDSAQGGSRSKI
jgi:hypothetical protein